MDISFYNSMIINSNDKHVSYCTSVYMYRYALYHELMHVSSHPKYSHGLVPWLYRFCMSKITPDGGDRSPSESVEVVIKKNIKPNLTFSHLHEPRYMYDLLSLIYPLAELVGFSKPS